WIEHRRALFQALRNVSPPEVLAALCPLLGRLCPRCPEAVRLLTEAIVHPEEGLRNAAHIALFCGGPLQPGTESFLVPLLRDHRPAVRQAGVWALSFIEPLTEAAVDGLCVALKHGDAELRFETARAICRLGPAVRRVKRRVADSEVETIVQP